MDCTTSTMSLLTCLPPVRTNYHVSTYYWSTYFVCTNDTCHFFIGPNRPLKSPFLGDMWHIVVLKSPCCTDRTRVTLVVVTCVTFDFDFFPFFPYLTTTLTSHNFFIQTLFEAIFAPLESYHQSLRNEFLLEIILYGQILSFFGSSWTFMSVLDPPRPLWAFWILLDDIWSPNFASNFKIE